jgi:cell shape-determining protein MreC
MGSVKNAMMKESDRNYERNRYYHQRQKLKERIRLYADNPNFVATLKRELEALEADWKARRK